MEIGKFKLAKADLVRPPNKPSQEQIIPKQKPYTEKVFKLEVDDFIKGFIGGFPKDEMLLKIQSVLDKAVDAGAIEPQEGIKYLRERKQQLVDFARENYGQELPGIEDRENFSQGSGGGRKKVEIPGLEEKTIELFEQNLSNNQVLKALKEFPEFKNTTIGVIKRIKKENNLGGQRKELFKSQEDKYKKLKTLVEESNNSPVLTKMKTLREKVGLPANTAPSDFKNYEKFDIPKLEKAPEKVKKEFIKIIDNPNIPVEDVFDVSSTLAKRIGTSVQTVGEVLNTMPEYQDFKPTARKLQNPYFKSGVMNKGKTLADVLEMSENIGPSSGYVSMGNTPERFILNSITRHIKQGGDKVEWVKAPSDLVTEAEAVFRYKGKDYKRASARESLEKSLVLNFQLRFV